MEEMLGNIAGCRQVFERWMEWEPEEQAWHSYINFELRYKEVDKARTIYERYILLLVFTSVVFWEEVALDQIQTQQQQEQYRESDCSKNGHKNLHTHILAYTNTYIRIGVMVLYYRMVNIKPRHPARNINRNKVEVYRHYGVTNYPLI